MPSFLNVSEVLRRRTVRRQVPFLGVGILLLFILVQPAAADPPTTFPFFIEFDDVNPCAPPPVHTVTMTGTVFLHDHDGRTIVRIPREISTSSGFEGRGELIEVNNGETLTFNLNDVLTNEATGDRILARGRLVVDLGTETVQVAKFALTCLGDPAGLG